MLQQLKYVLCASVVSFFMLSASYGLAANNDMRDLAYQVAEKSMQQWPQNKDEGLKLMIKAQALCPEDAPLNYNLGMAYQMYGRPSEAIAYLLKAVELDASHADWLNNTASVLLQLNTQSTKALQLAEQAQRLAPKDALILDTLAQAQYAAGQPLIALESAQQAALLNGASSEVKKRYGALRDNYVAHQLKQIQDGKVESGLSALAKLTSDASVSRIYGQALSRLNRTDQALNHLHQAVTRFSADQQISQLYDEVMEQQVRTFYQQFQRGDAPGALAASRQFAARYADSRPAQKAFDDLFNAFTNDTATINIPAPRQHQVASAGAVDADALLAGIGTQRAALEPLSVELTIDVDEQIPRGKESNPYAIAVVIGNRHYQRQNRGLTDVQFADRDAAIMRKYLIDLLGYKEKNILTYMDATGSDLRTVFGDGRSTGKLHDFIRAGKSEVFIYYVGHGAPSEEGEAYLVPVDTDVDYIANTGYPLNQLYKIIEKLPAKHTTVVLDACFSGDSMDGMLFKNISAPMLKILNPVQEVINSVIFSCADKDQVATWYPEKRHSTFTYYFLKGISGAADGDKNKQITVAELSSYLKEEVAYTARRQSSRKQDPMVKGDGQLVLATLR